MTRRPPIRFAAAAAVAALPAAAFAHAGEAHGGALLSIDQVLTLAAVTLVAALYAAGARRRWRPQAERRVEQRRSLLFVLGLGAIIVAVLPPIDSWSAQAASAHMIQHMLLMAAAPPLLVLAAPGPVILSGLPQGFARFGAGAARVRPLSAAWRFLTSAAAGLVALIVGLWAWHTPALYQTALTNDWVHWLEHVTFFGVSLLFWRALGDAADPEGDGAAAPLFALAALVQAGLLAALMTFSDRPWYPAYAETTALFGLTPLEDQRAAGMLMWIPGGVAFLIGALALLLRWFRRLEKRFPSRATTTLALPLLAAAALTGCDEPGTSADARWVVAGGDPQSGKRMIQFYQCGSCHNIPGIREADGVIGPPLSFWQKRAYIAGAVPNEPDNLIAWIMNPHLIEPGTAMPALGVTAPEARDIAAYLYTIEGD